MMHSNRTTAGKRLALQAAYYIREHSEQKFSLSEIAGALFVNSNYLARVFKHETGHTLLWYHNAVRCENAKKMLLETKLSVAEIGSAVGYISPAHFSHQFKKMTGVSPSDWRLKPEKSLQTEDPIDFSRFM
ncbi:MAG: AraC family transcriptional regulator [Clostridiales bacterium]|nr:AraC family transcriptional regulator [Clostridiales bacterium]